MTVGAYSTPCLKKQSESFLSYIRQIFTNVNNFWHKDGQDDRIMKKTLNYYLS